MARYDTEQFLKDVETKFKSKISGKITALNTEKGDFNLDDITESQFFIEHIPQIWNYPVIIVWTINETRQQTRQNDNLLKSIEVDYNVLLSDSGNSKDQSWFWKLLRYSRALADIAHENFDSYQGVTKTQIEDLLPTSWTVSPQKVLRAGGIRIIASFTDR